MNLTSPPDNGRPAASARLIKPECSNQITIAAKGEDDSPPPPLSSLRRIRGALNTAKRVMVVGPTGAGKSSLLKALGLSDEPVSKTEHVRITPKSIDTPGEMLDIPSLYHALITSSAKADIILFVADPSRKCSFPVRMAKALRAPVVGVVTKTDLANPEEKARAHKALKRAGVERTVETSIVDGSGLEDLIRLIS